MVASRSSLLQYALASLDPRSHRGHDLMRRVVEIVRRDHVKARVAEDLLAKVHVCPLEAHDQRNFEAHFLDRCNHPLGDDVAAHDATKYVDKNALYVPICGDDFERCRDLVLGGAAADVQKV